MVAYVLPTDGSAAADACEAGQTMMRRDRKELVQKAEPTEHAQRVDEFEPAVSEPTTDVLEPADGILPTEDVEDAEPMQQVAELTEQDARSETGSSSETTPIATTAARRFIEVPAPRRALASMVSSSSSSDHDEPTSPEHGLSPAVQADEAVLTEVFSAVTGPSVPGEADTARADDDYNHAVLACWRESGNKPSRRVRAEHTPATCAARPPSSRGASPAGSAGGRAFLQTVQRWRRSHGIDRPVWAELDNVIWVWCFRCRCMHACAQCQVQSNPIRCDAMRCDANVCMREQPLAEFEPGVRGEQTLPPPCDSSRATVAAPGLPRCRISEGILLEDVCLETEEH